MQNFCFLWYSNQQRNPSELEQSILLKKQWAHLDTSAGFWWSYYWVYGGHISALMFCALLLRDFKYYSIRDSR